MTPFSFACLFAASSAPSLAADPGDRVVEMHQLLADAIHARDAIIQGDLVAARRHGEGVATAELTSLVPRKQRGLAKQLGKDARALVEADGLAAAARAVGSLGGTCARCHTATGGGPALALDAIPEQDAQPEGVQAHMALHQWATSLLWMGLVSPSAEAWDRGAARLEHTDWLERFDPEPSSQGFPQLEQIVHLVGSISTEQTTPARRAEVFGLVIGTCAECHAARDAGKVSVEPTSPGG